MSLAFGARRGRYLEVSRAEAKRALSTAENEELEALDLLYRALCAILYNFGRHVGVGSSYGAFLAPLGHVAARLHAIGAQARQGAWEEPYRPMILVCAHAGLSGGRTGRWGGGTAPLGRAAVAGRRGSRPGPRSPLPPGGARGLFEALEEELPGAGPACVRLREDHRCLRDAVRALLAEVSSRPAGSGIEAVCEHARAAVQRLTDHEARENALLARCLGDDHGVGD